MAGPHSPEVLLQQDWGGAYEFAFPSDTGADVWGRVRSEPLGITNFTKFAMNICVHTETDG